MYASSSSNAINEGFNGEVVNRLIHCVPDFNSGLVLTKCRLDLWNFLILALRPAGLFLLIHPFISKFQFVMKIEDRPA